MKHSLKLVIAISISSSTVFAANSTNTVNVVTPQNTSNASSAVVITNNPSASKSSASQPSTPQLSVAGLSSNDSTAQDVSSLKKQIEIEKLKKQLDTAKGGASNNSGPVIQSAAPRKPTDPLKSAVVTDVVINKATNVRVATILFSDGTYLDMDEGSRIGDYVVSNITMQGANLVKYGKNGKKTSTIPLRRVYGRTVGMDTGVIGFNNKQNNKNMAQNPDASTILSNSSIRVPAPPTVDGSSTDNDIVPDVVSY